jgi:hypothetical protein
LQTAPFDNNTQNHQCEFISDPVWLNLKNFAKNCL